MWTTGELSTHGTSPAERTPVSRSNGKFAGYTTVALAAAALMILIQCGPVAAWTISTDRPDFADDTGAAPVGLLQVESGYSYSRAPGEKQHTLGEWMFRTGLSGWSDIRLGLDSYLHDGASGWGDGSLDVRFRLLRPEDDSRPGALSLTLIAGTSLPTGSREFSAHRLQPALMLTSALTLSDRATLAPAVNYSLKSSAEGQYSEFTAGGSFILDIGAKLCWYMESYATLVESGFGRNTGFAGSGFLWLLHDNLQLDIHGLTALNWRSPDYSLGAGLSFFFPVR